MKNSHKRICKGCPTKRGYKASAFYRHSSAARIGRNRWTGLTKGLKTMTKHELVLIRGIDLLETYIMK